MMLTDVACALGTGRWKQKNQIALSWQTLRPAAAAHDASLWNARTGWVDALLGAHVLVRPSAHSLVDCLGRGGLINEHFDDF